MKNVKIKNLNSKIVIIFILGLICFSSVRLNNTSDYISKNENTVDEMSPRSSVFLENRTDYSKQLVIDSQFDIAESSSPWSSEEEDDITDVDTNLNVNQANYKVVGEQNTFSDINGIPQSSDWTSMQNSEFPAYPEWPAGGSDSYGIDSDGCWTRHEWEEGPKQTPSIQWHRNFTMPNNMTDYKITSANVSAIVNGSVDSNIDVNEALGDVPDGSDDRDAQGVVYDNVRFYVSIADTSLENIYEVAFYQTFELGLYIDLGNNVLEIEKYMNMVLEENLLFYLTQVLSFDHENFTVILGMNIFSEDNCWSDQDYWDMLRIKNVNFTFTYEKKIDQLTSASWVQTGNKIDNGEYELGDDGYFIINNALLSFDYNISQDWPSSSLNSEFRIYLNNYQISKTLKLTNFSTSIQNQIIDISPSLLNVNQNITLKLQLFIADNFQLSNNITVTLDNVNLTTHFTVVERRNPVETKLETDGLSRSVTWNESFSITLNYTNASNQVGITGSDFIVDWVDTYEIQEEVNGIYTLICNNTHKVSSTPYTLRIITNITNTWYESNSLAMEINIIGRETKIDVFLNKVNMTLSPEIDLYYLNQLNITTHYYDNESSEEILGATALLEGSGIDPSFYTYDAIGPAHQFILNTTKLGLGTHLLSLFVEKENYTESYQQLRITVNSRLTDMDVFLNEDDLTLSPVIEVQFMSQLNITTHYYDNTLSEVILGATASLEGGGIDPSYYTYDVIGSAHQFILNTTKLGFGTHPLSLFVEKDNYTTSVKQIRITVTPRQTYLNVFENGVDSSDIDEIETPISSQLSFSFFYYDTITSEQLEDFDMSLGGLDVSSYSSTHNNTAYNFVINTSRLGLGLHIASFLTEKTNYQPISKIMQIIVRQIHTEISTNHANQSYTIEIGQDFDLNLFIKDVDFDTNISGCEVSYSSSLGSGVINETDESGTYSMTFEDVSRGNYIIYISVFKGPEYKFEQFEITLNVINPLTSDQGIPDFVFYIMGVLMVGLIASFIAYQQYFKFPKNVREIKSLSKAIKKGKAAEKVLSVKAADDLFVEDYISRTKDSLPSKNKALLKDHSVPISGQKSMTKGDVKKDIKGEKAKIQETQKVAPKITKEEKKPDISRKPSSLEENLELPKAEQPKKVESTQKIEKLKPDQFVKPHDIENSDLQPISADPKLKKIRYLRKPKIKELPKKTSKKP